MKIIIKHKTEDGTGLKTIVDNAIRYELNPSGCLTVIGDNETILVPLRNVFTVQVEK